MSACVNGCAPLSRWHLDRPSLSREIAMTLFSACAWRATMYLRHRVQLATVIWTLRHLHAIALIRQCVGTGAGKSRGRPLALVSDPSRHWAFFGSFLERTFRLPAHNRTNPPQNRQFDNHSSSTRTMVLFSFPCELEQKNISLPWTPAAPEDFRRVFATLSGAAD